MLDVIVAALRGAWAAASAAQARRRDIAALRAMDARALSDLGIERAQIVAYVDGRLARPAPRPRRAAPPVLRLVRSA
ncbi:MAG: DUF1127 domain-containing protein [Rubrimonas sp.]|uniref:DUF1127 domain-containing protein n=1 Tax=Rubrimonas sp. TaxID=2036015 RepID=UPI002FDCF5AD